MDESVRSGARNRRYVTESLRADVVPTRSTVPAIEKLVSYEANTDFICGNLVSMTRLEKPKLRSLKQGKPRTKRPAGHWVLQDAKARFSELVRRVRSDGPQHVTVHGRDEVVVIAADEFRRLKGNHTGQALIDAIQSSPYRETNIEPERMVLPVRNAPL